VEGESVAQIEENETIDRDPKQGVPLLTAHNLALLEKPRAHVVGVHADVDMDVSSAHRGPGMCVSGCVGLLIITMVSRDAGVPNLATVPAGQILAQPEAGAPMDPLAAMSGSDPQQPLPYPPKSAGVPGFMVPPPAFTMPPAAAPTLQLPSGASNNASRVSLLSTGMFIVLLRLCEMPEPCLAACIDSESLKAGARCKTAKRAGEMNLLPNRAKHAND
jgi:hypothetical protein